MEQQEAERQRIAAELHDSLGQNLSILLNRATLASAEPDTGPHASDHLAGISATAREALASVREICHDLRPVELDRLGLSKTLEAVAERLAASSGLKISAEIDPVNSLASPNDWIQVLRFVQESLNNVVKHAHATEANVSVREDDDCLRLVIADDGCGFDLSAVSHGRGLGLHTLAERARILRAQIRIETVPGRGTKVRLDIPKK
jgi:signal transduction histidine kinase